MTLLTPLGLLGLLAIAVLILIYIIRPNFQQKRVSSTYMWKLSLKYKKKSVPLSKFRNILIFFCQTMILISCAVILAQPNLILKEQLSQTEVIVVLDSSASMLTETLEETRYERAINKIVNDFEHLTANDLQMSIIVADNQPYFLLERAFVSSKTMLVQSVQDLLDDPNSCSYGSADIDAAMSLCESILMDNPSAQVYLYTDNEYSYVPGNVKVVDVAADGEWNAAILNATATLEDNYYVFTVEVACYGRDANIELNLAVQKVNANDVESGGGKTVDLQTTVTCTQDVTKTIIFKYFGTDGTLPPTKENTEYCVIESQDKIFSYDSVHIYLTEEDSFTVDNSFDIYGGQKEPLKIQYASTHPNAFFNSVLDVLANHYRNNWAFEITEVRDVEKVARTGYDFYIFEQAYLPGSMVDGTVTPNIMPSTMPTDGVVLLVNPVSMPDGVGIRIDGNLPLEEDWYLSAEEDHAIMANVRADKISVRQYGRVVSYDDSKYKVLMKCDTSPVLLVKNEPAITEDGFIPGEKVAVMTFSLNFSNYTLLYDFPMMIYNMFEYFLPTTVNANSFEVFEQISLNTRGSELDVLFGGDTLYRLTEFPASISANLPGSYQLNQTSFSGKKVSETIYIKIPAAESNIHAVEDTFRNPYNVEDTNDYLQDLLFYLAAVLVAFLFAEWLLHLREEV